MFQPKPTTWKDGYKTSHPDQYTEGTQFIYSNITPRGSRVKGINEVVVFGFQYFIKEYLINGYNRDFFGKPKDEVVARYKRRLDNYLGPDAVPMHRIAALHDLGYLPIEIKALPEGSLCQVRVPMLTIQNTLPEFYWLTNDLETILCNVTWGPITSATIAREYHKILSYYADETSDIPEFVRWQGHDFSMRGMMGLEAACMSGAGHLLSFTGTDTIPAIDFLEEYYNADCTKELIGGSVPACYDDQTEILTNYGFKLFKDLTSGDLVGQYHEDGKVDFVLPNTYFDDYYKGPMIHFIKNGYHYVDLKVTPNHKMVRYNKTEGIVELFEAGSKDYQLRKGYSHRNSLIVAGRLSTIKQDGLSDLDKLKIAFQADGSFPSREDAYTGERSGTFPIRFSLKKIRKIKRLESILRELNIACTTKKDIRGYQNFWMPLTEKLSKNFDWVDLSKVSLKWAQSFVHELGHWDGSFKRFITLYYTTNKSCADFAQAIGAIAGYKTHLGEYLDPRGDRKMLYTITFDLRKDTVSGEDVQKLVEEYEGHVYCVSVPSKMIIVRRNGVVAICGNTEHSVECVGGVVEGSNLEEGERNTLIRLLTKVYPKGIVSVVSDTYDYWNTLTQILPSVKDIVLARDGKLVIRPDSGDPEKIICGDPDTGILSPEYAGSIQILWNIFGGTINSKGYKQLDPHIGLIYGDSITMQRAESICAKLKRQGFASTNIVFGIGSYTYQHQTRDTFGLAMKATHAIVNGKAVEIYKTPKTDSGIKNSARGLLCVNSDGSLKQQCSLEESQSGLLETVFKNGYLYKDFSLAEIRERLKQCTECGR